MTFRHGSYVDTNVSSYVAPVRRTNRSHVGIVGLGGTTGGQLDLTKFPANKVVRLTPGNAPTLIPALGDDAPLRKQIQRLWNVIACPVAVVRVEKGADTAATLTNVTGNSIDKTGIYALLGAYQEKVYPKTIIAPGWTSQTRDDGIVSITVSNGGSGFVSGAAVTFTGGGGTGAAATAQGEGGRVTGFTITNPGKGYTSSPTVAVAGVTGATFVANTGDLANPVVTAGKEVCSRLRAVMPFDLDPNEDAVKEADIYVADDGYRLYCGYPPAIFQGDSGPVNGSWATVTAGRMVELLASPVEWYQSVSNKSLPGVLGAAVTIDKKEANYLNEHQVATILTRSDGSIVNWGNYTLASATASGYKLYHAVRIADAIEEAIERANEQFVDRCYGSAQFVETVVENVNDFLRRLIGTAIVGGHCYAVPEDQDPENLRVRYDFTVAYIAQGISAEARIVNTYKLNFPAR